jgi:hypothetical protein
VSGGVIDEDGGRQAEYVNVMTKYGGEVKHVVASKVAHIFFLLLAIRMGVL